MVTSGQSGDHITFALSTSAAVKEFRLQGITEILGMNGCPVSGRATIVEVPVNYATITDFTNAQAYTHAVATMNVYMPNVIFPFPIRCAPGNEFRIVVHNGDANPWFATIFCRKQGYNRRS